MGSPVLDPDKIPIAAEEKRVLQMPLEVEGKIWKITGVSMGNPHAVTFVEDVRGLDLEKIGPGFEPVSYTHLDVYKRQSLLRCILIFFRIGNGK